MYVVVMTYIWIGRSWIFYIIEVLWYCMCYFSFRWGPFVHPLGIVQWNSTRRGHPGNPGGVSGSGLVTIRLSLSSVYLIIPPFASKMLPFYISRFEPIILEFLMLPSKKEDLATSWRTRGSWSPPRWFAAA